MDKWVRLIERLALPLIIASALSVLAFRYFITLDGPVHVLHAAVLEASWTTPQYIADGVAYDLRMIDVQLGDLVLMVLLHLCSPVMAHAWYAALVMAALGAGAFLLAGSLGSGVSAWILWVLPFTFSYVLILGFLHFLLAVAFAMAVVAWWLRRKEITWRSILMLITAVSASYFIHRTGPLLVLLLPAALEAARFIGGDEAGRRRWSGLRLQGVALITGLGLSVGLGLLAWSIWEGSTRMAIGDRDPLHDLVTLRPLILLAREKERWGAIILGVLLLASLSLAVRERLKLGRRMRSSDGLWLVALVVLIASVVFHSPRSVALFLGERLQVLALLLLAVWMATLPARTIGSLVMLAVVVVHALRLVNVESRMADLHRQHEEMMEAASHLSPGSTVLGVHCEPNWLLSHLSAYAALQHKGIFLSRRDHLHFVLDDPPLPALDRYLRRKGSYLGWLQSHNANGKRPVIGHVLLVGSDPALRDSAMRSLAAPLRNWYDHSFSNGSMTVYTRRSP